MNDGRPGALRGQRGAVLVQVTLAMLGLLGLTAFVFDYGVLWVSRGQAQNAADAGALAAAVSLAFEDPDDAAGARARGRAVALRNPVWGAPPDVREGDITFPACPAGAPGLDATCVKVEVFRNQRPGGQPLPTFFGRLVGVGAQGVRAVAMGQVYAGSFASCVKPWAIPDRWLERRPVAAPWTEGVTFERYRAGTGGSGSGDGSGGSNGSWGWEEFWEWFLRLLCHLFPHGAGCSGGGSPGNGGGGDSGGLLDPADVYVPPGEPGYTGLTIAEYGRRVVLKNGSGPGPISPWTYQAVVVDPDAGGGANAYRSAIDGCSPSVIGPGTVLETEPDDVSGATRQGVQALLNADPNGYWNAQANNGRGAPAGGCMTDGSCGISPRLVAVAVYDVDRWDAARTGGRSEVVVAKVLGVWLESLTPGGDVVGYLTYYPAVVASGPAVDPEESFLRAAMLVR